MTKLVYVDYGLANNMGDYIEINKDLEKYPELYNAILKHELEHTAKEGFTTEDLVVDLKPTNINYWQLIKFMAKHPRSLVQLSPIFYKNNTFYYDINMALTWLFSIALVCLVVYVLK